MFQYCFSFISYPGKVRLIKIWLHAETVVHIKKQFLCVKIHQVFSTVVKKVPKDCFVTMAGDLDQDDLAKWAGYWYNCVSFY